MRLVRLVLGTAITGGLLLTAEQRFTNRNKAGALFGIMKTPPMKLPHPMSSATERIASGDWANQTLVLRGIVPQGLALAQTDRAAKQCSIPLTRYKISTEIEFFIREAPVPRDPAHMDEMPVFQAPVCGDPARPPAH
jgi:hypothetical protein